MFGFKSKLFFLVALFPVFSASGVVISSECENETFAFFLKNIGGGSDDIGASGSWSKAITNGWHRIGPFKDVEMPREWIAARITSKGVSLTRWDSTDKNVVFGCHHPSEGKTYEIWTHGRGDKPVKDCLNEGGQWVPFEKISIYGKYTLNRANCEARQLDPNRVRYHWTDRHMHFVPIEGKTWHMVTDRDTRMWEVFRDNNAIILERGGPAKMFFMLKNEGVYTKDALSDPNWSRLAEGEWVL